MSLLVRAIVRGADAPLALADLVAVEAAGLAALASSVVAAPPPAEDALRAHDAITRRIHELVPSLPARYGQTFADADALADALRERSGQLENALERVDGRLELAITLRWRDRGVPVPARDAGSGREYLALRAAAERERREAERIVERFVGEMACEQAFVRHKTCPRPGVAAIVALLIGTGEIAATRERVASFGKRSTDVSAVVDGVFAPYSFAS